MGICRTFCRSTVNGSEPRAVRGELLLFRQPKLPEKASMCSHMGLAASRSPGKERLLYNGAGQGLGRNRTEDQSQNQKDTGHGRPFIVAEPAWTDNEAAT